MKVIQACALSGLCGASMLFASVPVIAVVVHRHHNDHLAAAYPKAHSLILYDKNGYRVAYCNEKNDEQDLSDCHAEPGYDLNDVMSAWLHAYQER